MDEYIVTLLGIEWDREVDGVHDHDAQLPDDYQIKVMAESRENARAEAEDCITNEFGFCISGYDQVVISKA